MPLYGPAAATTTAVAAATTTAVAINRGGGIHIVHVVNSSVLSLPCRRHIVDTP